MRFVRLCFFLITCFFNDYIPILAIPLDAIKKNPNMAIILTDYGGHIGFVEGPTIRSRSFVERLFHQYASCMLNVKH